MSELKDDDEVMIVSAYEYPQDQVMMSVDAPEPEPQPKQDDIAVISSDEHDQNSEYLDGGMETNDSYDVNTIVTDDSYNSSGLLDKSSGNEAKKMRKSLDARKQFGCNLCGKRFSQKASLNTHLKNHDETYTQELKCEICGKVFASKAVKTTHVKSIHEGCMYKCPKCGETKKLRNTILLHIERYHMGEDIGEPIEIPKD